MEQDRFGLTKIDAETFKILKIYGEAYSIGGEKWYRLPFSFKEHSPGYYEVLPYDALSIEKSPKLGYAILTPQQSSETTFGIDGQNLPDNRLAIVTYNYQISANVPLTDDDCAQLLKLANSLVQAKINANQ